MGETDKSVGLKWEETHMDVANNLSNPNLMSDLTFPGKPEEAPSNCRFTGKRILLLCHLIWSDKRNRLEFLFSCMKLEGGWLKNHSLQFYFLQLLLICFPCLKGISPTNFQQRSGRSSQSWG